MPEYLIFVKLVNYSQGRYTYQFDFSEDVETAWGDGWNVAPSGLIPNITPEKNAISNSYRITTDLSLHTACKNTCFSMQDCIDGIIALAFTDINDTDEVIFNFGDKYEDVMQILVNHNCKIEHLKLDNGEDIINDLIDDLGGNNDE